MNPEDTFTLANIIFIIGTLLLFSKVIKNKDILNDFDLIGSILTSLGMFMMLAGYYKFSMFLSIIFSMPTFLFWVFVSFHRFKKVYGVVV